MDGKHSKNDGCWISLMEYAIRKGVSLSTLRRHIKDRKLDYKIENGRYLLLDDRVDNPKSNPFQMKKEGEAVEKLSLELLHAHEEIAELKMLIALYEEKIPEHDINS